MNADDFGLSSEVNQAIEACYRNGILRSASLMPNGEAFEAAVETAQSCPGLGVGIHLSLVGECSVAPARELGALVDGDGFLPPSYQAFAKRLFLKSFTLEHVRREVQAQLRRFQASGLIATHLDSHQHVHLLPGVLDIALQAAEEAGIPVIRLPRDPNVAAHFPRNLRQLQLYVLNGLSRRAAGRAHGANRQYTDYFWGLDFSGALNEAALLHLLECSRPGLNEIMCHPAFSTPALRAKYQWGFQWDAEAAALQSPTVQNLVRARQIHLASFREVTLPN